MALGESRALGARDYLIKLGIDGERLLPQSFGEEKPVDPGHTAAARARNRRAEFVIYGR
jgi:peptidoglycan-associated lipoprotein